MLDWIVPLSDVSFDEEEVEAVAAAYRSGWLSQGPAVAAFEAGFAAYAGSTFAVAASSGTAALHLILVALGVGVGDEVVLPSLTFAATAAAVVHANATPVFADVVSLDRPWLCPSAVAAAIGPRTRAVLNVEYGGYPGAVDELRSLADAHGLALIEDAAHAVGASAGDRRAGTIGDAGAFSFFANKNMPLGEGGMLVTDHPFLAERARLLRSHGMTADTWARHRGDATDYEVLEPGFNYRLDEARAALGLKLLRRLDADNDRRAALARRYSDRLRGLSGVRAALPLDDGSVRSSWHLYPVLLEPSLDRTAFRSRLRDAGVQTSVHYPPLHRTQAFARWARGELPVTEEYARRTVTLPLFPHMTKAQHEVVVDVVARAVR